MTLMTPLRLVRTLCSSLILVAALGAGAARADTFISGTINFQVIDGNCLTPSGQQTPCPPNAVLPAGSFTYDQTTSTFTSFIVTYDGATYDFVNDIAPGNGKPIQSGS